MALIIPWSVVYYGFYVVAERMRRGALPLLYIEPVAFERKSCECVLQDMCHLIALSMGE
jgi:hypothetical protein